MKPGRVVLDYLASLEDAMMMARIPSVVMPFAVFAAVQCVVLVALGLFPIPPFSYVIVPLIERLGGEAALHYPTHFIALPNMFHSVYLVLFVLPGFILFGSGVNAMAEYVGARDKVSLRTRPSLAAAAPARIVIGVVYVVFAAGIPATFAMIAAGITNAQIAQIVGLAGIAISIAAQAFLIYGLLSLRTTTTNPFAALGRSFALGRANFPVTFLLITTVVLVHAPIDFLLANTDGLAIKFRPELVLYVLLAGTFVELVTTFFLFGATTAISLSRREVGGLR